MEIVEFRFLRAGNVIASQGGAIIGLRGDDLASHHDADRLCSWMRQFSVAVKVSRADLDGDLGVVVANIAFACTQRARLVQAPLRILRRQVNDLLFWLPVDDRQAAIASVQLAVAVVQAVQQGQAPDARHQRLWQQLCLRFWNQTHAHLATAAKDLNIPCYRLDLDGQQFLQLGQGSRLRLCRETLTDQTPLLARIASNKQGLHALLQSRGVPLPAQRAVASIEQALAAADCIGWPVVLKPVDGAKGKGVWVGLKDADALRRAWQANASGAPALQLVQQTLSGADHRLLVVNGVLMAVAKRQPAAIEGDGQCRLREQIEALNADPERGVGYESLLNQVPLDGRLALLLEEQGLTLESVPPPGRRVQLSRTANLSEGGTATDCSDVVHPDNRRLAEDIARLLGTDVVGLDLISRDISVSWRQGGTWLLEANLSPGLRPHLVANPQSDLCQRIVRAWVGEGPRAGRIPTALITGSIGKTTTSRLLAHLLETAGLRVGLTGTLGMQLDGQLLAKGDLAAGGAALQLLQDRRVEAMVAEIARGGLLQSGLGLAPADVTAVLNVRDNHIGIDGIRSRRDLARIKGLVAQAADGLLALNADDPLVLAMGKQRQPESLALVSEEPGNSVWQAHREAGHLAALYSMRSDGVIQLFRDGELCLQIGLREIPAADDGAISAIAPAAAFAIALAHGLGVTLPQMRQGLVGFGEQPQHRQGRFEVVVRQPWEVVLTWADGVEAMASLSRYAQARTETDRRRRVLLCSAPDNRPDLYLRTMGEATWGFDLVICAAWDRRRGRNPEEVPALLADGARRLGPGGPEVLVAGTESQAVVLLAQQIRPGDLCVICSFDTEPMRQLLLQALGG